MPIAIQAFHVDDLVSEEGEIEWVVKQLHNNRSGGLSRIQAEHVKRWLMAAQKADKYRDMAGGEEEATTTAERRPKTTAAQ